MRRRPPLLWVAKWGGGMACIPLIAACVAGFWSGSDTDHLEFTTPFCQLLLVIGIPTIIVWYLDRPPKSRHCPCGYDLTGYSIGVCPECSQPFGPKGRRAMRRRPRLLRVAKWGGAAVCVLLAATWAVSTLWVVAYHGSHRSIAVMDGEFVAFWLAEEKVPRWWINRLDGAHSTYGFTLPSYGRSAVLLDDQTTPRSTMFSVPIWMPFLLTVAVSAYLFRIDRRPLPGHCPCGYNLTGNVSGTCPECGVEAEK